MADSMHPAAPHNLPSFITAPGETDWLMVFLAFFLAVVVLMFGVLYFNLHSLPERLAHKSKKIQFELVAVLGLISLFTHQHIFWIAGLILALIDLPDFGTPLGRIAGSMEKLAGVKHGEGAEAPGEGATGGKAPEETATHETPDVKRGDETIDLDKTQKTRKELSHA